MSRRGQPFTRDEFDYSETSSPQEGSKKASRTRIYAALLERLEAEGIFKPAIIAAVVIIGLIAGTALGLVIWSIVSGHAAKNACEAAITSMQSAGTLLASQIQSLASSVTSITSQEVTPSPPLTLDQVFNAICATGSGNVGVQNVSELTQDDCDSIYIVTSSFKVPNGIWAGVAYEACAMLGPTLDGLNQFRMAVYTDDGYGVPGDIVGVSDIGVVAGNSISCVPLNVSIGALGYFWLALMSNANDCGSINSLWYETTPGLRSGFTDAFAWPDFPDTLNSPSFTYFSAVYGMYVSYNATCINKFS